MTRYILEIATIKSKPIRLNLLADDPINSLAGFDTLDASDQAVLDAANWESLEYPTELMLQFFSMRDFVRGEYFRNNTFAIVVVPAYNTCFNEGQAVNTFRQLKDATGLQHIKSLDIIITDSPDDSIIMLHDIIELGQRIVEAGVKPECVKLKSNLSIEEYNLSQSDVSRLITKALDTGFRFSNWRERLLATRGKRADAWTAPYYDFFDDGEVEKIIGGDEDSEVYWDFFA